MAKIICEICGKEYPVGHNSFSRHLKKHNLTPKEYYLKYIDDDNLCPKCGKERPFISIFKGFGKCNCKEFVKCEICGKEYQELKYHVQNTHHIKYKDYYDKYLKTDTDGLCKRCGKPTKFLDNRYSEFCSKSCSSKYHQETMSDQQRLNINNKISETLKSDEYKEKMTEYWSEKYGEDIVNPFQATEVKNQIKETNLERYGTENPFASEEIKDKIKQTVLERYGVEYIAQSEEIQQKIEETMLEKYGVRNAFQLESTKDVAYKGFQKWYNNGGKFELIDRGSKIYTKWWSNITDEKLKKWLDKRYATMEQNGTFAKSAPEDDFYNTLKTVYPNVKRHYRDERYPFNCDFYIPERDLFIELNLYWTHSGHWFNGSEDDLALVKRRENKSDFYKNANYTWTELDVRKRQIAKENNLNYIVFWDIDDIKLWFSLNMPDGQDYIKEYTWLPDIELTNDIKYTFKPGNFTLITKSIHFEEFFKNELKAWKENKYQKRGTLQSNLFNNRLKYINKNPYQLSHLQILRGLNISGKIKAYSTFNYKPLEYLIKKYNITELYDPCAGWGERLLTCKYFDVKYLGIDINENLKPGYEKIMTDKQKVIFTDSAKYKNTTKQFTFTCPPYWNKEIYSDDGAENLTYEEFLDWWNNVVKNANTEYFAFQIDEMNKNNMTEIIIQNGYEIVEEFDAKTKTNHFNKSNKKEKETIVVLRRSE